MPKLSTNLYKAAICLLISHFAFAGKIALSPEVDVTDRYRINQEEREAIGKLGYFGAAAKTCEQGVIIYYMDPAGPAVKTGFKYGDIISGIDNQKIADKNAYLDFMSKTRAGQELTVTFLRDGKKKKLGFTLDPLSPANVRSKLKMKLGESLRDIARAAYDREDYDNAIEYYEAWLYADPQDRNSWYNLACTYALNGNKEKSLEAWEYTVDAGWEDSEHPLKDKDLELIRGEERFKKSLERCANNKHLGDPIGYERNYIEMQSLGTYIVMLPPDYEEFKKEYPLCLILHGSGSSEIGHGDLSDRLGRDGVIYIAPRASYPHTGQFMDQRIEGWTAWPPYDFGKDTPFSSIINNISVEWIFRCAADAKERYRVLGDKVYIVGHSQGAFLAIACAALHPELVNSYFAYAGFVPDFCIEAEALAGIKKHDVKPYLAHGTKDKVVEPEESKKAEKAMKETGVDCILRLFEEATHYISADVDSFMREWVNTEVRAVQE